MNLGTSHSNGSKPKIVNSHHHHNHPLISQSALLRKNPTLVLSNSSSKKNFNSRPRTVIRHNVNGSSKWQFRSRQPPKMVNKSPIDSSLFKLHPSNQGLQGRGTHARSSVVFGPEIRPGADRQLLPTIEERLKMPASLAIVMLAALFFTLTLAATLTLGAICRKKRRFKNSGCASDLSSFSTSSPSSNSSGAKNKMGNADDEEDEEEEDGRGDDDDAAGSFIKKNYRSHQNRAGASCENDDDYDDDYGDIYHTYRGSMEICSQYPGSLSWLQEEGSSSYMNDTDYRGDVCHGSYPWLACDPLRLPGTPWILGPGEYEFLCVADGPRPPNFRMTEMKVVENKIESETDEIETESSDRNPAPDNFQNFVFRCSCSLNDLTGKPVRRLLKRPSYDRIADIDASHGSSFGSIYSHPEIPTNSGCFGFVNEKRISRMSNLSATQSFGTISTRASLLSVEKPKSKTYPENESKTKNFNHSTAYSDVSNDEAEDDDETEAMLVPTTTNNKPI